MWFVYEQGCRGRQLITCIMLSSVIFIVKIHHLIIINKIMITDFFRQVLHSQKPGSSIGIYCGYNALEQSFLRPLRFLFPCYYHSTSAPHLYFGSPLRQHIISEILSVFQESAFHFSADTQKGGNRKEE